MEQKNANEIDPKLSENLQKILREEFPEEESKGVDQVSEPHADESSDDDSDYEEETEKQHIQRIGKLIDQGKSPEYIKRLKK